MMDLIEASVDSMECNCRKKRMQTSLLSRGNYCGILEKSFRYGR